ncbi:isochorismatase family protein [Bordetella tumulicola]|uniref:isochorismatase family protein n=1 Tax=Bordetella tumulicola TaxID=1649133 RepID=UPI0039F0014E
MDKLEKWRGYVPDEELETYRKGGFANRIGIGKRPALVNIDTTHMFVDPSYSFCGAAMPELISALDRITALFRKLNLPVYYSRRDDRSLPAYRGAWNLKLAKPDDVEFVADPKADEWPASYGPQLGDRVIMKNKPSAFFGTMLADFLRYDEVDTVIMVGISTSGCVRASAVDAFSHNFRIVLVEEACGDRSAQAHKANLFDLDMKFADVESLDDICEELQKKFG